MRERERERDREREKEKEGGRFTGFKPPKAHEIHIMLLFNKDECLTRTSVQQIGC